MPRIIGKTAKRKSAVWLRRSRSQPFRIFPEAVRLTETAINSVELLADMDDLRAKEVIKTMEGLEDLRRPWEGIWDKLRRRIMPRRGTDETQSQIPEDDIYEFSSVACDALNTLAAGHLTHITPFNQVWFKYNCQVKSEPSDKWYTQCSEYTWSILGRSNFYPEAHEMYIDRCLYGIGCLYMGGENSRTISFKYIPCKTYAAAENSSGAIDTLGRRFKFSAKQAADEWGEERLGKKVREALGDSRKKYDICFEFIHLVRPRKKWKPGATDPMNRQFQSIYVSVEDAIVIEESGYYEFPYLVTRFLKWGTGPYGLPPGLFAFPDIRRELFLDDTMDSLGELSVNPRFAILAQQSGEVDMRAGGMTVISEEAARLNMPRELGTQARYDIGADRIERTEEKIRKAFYADVFRIVSNVDREMTATEVIARQSETVLSFAPAFTLMVSDFRPWHERLFAILMRAGEFDQFGPPPREALFVGHGGDAEVLEPVVTYSGKMALALDLLQSDGIDRGIQFAAMLAQFDPGVLMNIDMDKLVRSKWRSSHAPEDLLNDEEEVQAAKQQQAQAAAQQQEMETAGAGAKAARDGVDAAARAKEAGISL